MYYDEVDNCEIVEVQTLEPEEWVDTGQVWEIIFWLALLDLVLVLIWVTL